MGAEGREWVCLGLGTQGGIGKKKLDELMKSVLHFNDLKYTQVEQMCLLIEVLRATSEAAGRAVAEIVDNGEVNKYDRDTRTLLNAFSKLNVAGRADALKYVQRLQYVPEYQLPEE